MIDYIHLEALKQGYIYFRDRRCPEKIHKGYIACYFTEYNTFRNGVNVYYGLHFTFNDGTKDVYLEDCEEYLIRDPRKSPIWQSACLFMHMTEMISFAPGSYGLMWALNKEELKPNPFFRFLRY